MAKPRLEIADYQKVSKNGGKRKSWGVPRDGLCSFMENEHQGDITAGTKTSDLGKKGGRTSRSINYAVVS